MIFFYQLNFSTWCSNWHRRRRVHHTKS